MSKKSFEGEPKKVLMLGKLKGDKLDVLDQLMKIKKRRKETGMDLESQNSRPTCIFEGTMRTTEEKDLEKVKGYIHNIETVLQDLKDWVSCKEKSVSSKNSFCSKKVKGLEGGLEGDKLRKTGSRRSERERGRHNVFFGESSEDCEERVFDRSFREPGEESDPRLGIRRQEEQGHIRRYLKARVMGRLGREQRPPLVAQQGKVLDAGRYQSKESSADRFFQKAEVIEYLTPVKTQDLKKSCANLNDSMEFPVRESCKETRVDSLVYTHSKKRNSLRLVKTESDSTIQLFD